MIGERLPVVIVDERDRRLARTGAVDRLGDGRRLQRVGRDRAEEQVAIGEVVEQARRGGRRAGDHAGVDDLAQTCEGVERRRRTDDRVDVAVEQ